MLIIKSVSINNDTMQNQRVLEETGMTKNEAKVYLALLEFGESLPGTIARRSGVKRSTTYLILNRLEDKGLVSKVKKRGHLHFHALNPYALAEKEHQKYKNLELILPELTALRGRNKSKPQVSFFEGKAGLIQIMEDTLRSKTDLLLWANVELSVTTILADYYPTYIKKKVERGLWVRGIVNDDKVAREMKASGKEELRELYLISKEDFPFENEINIYDDKVAIVSHTDQVGVIIQNEHIAKTQRNIFKFAFKQAKTIDKQNQKKAH
jgi:sugar-specific transcriptional regulator TrmB